MTAPKKTWEELTPEQQKALYDSAIVENKEAIAKLEEATAKLEEATEFNAELQSQLDKAEIQKDSEFPVVKCNGTNYQVTIPQFKFDGADVKATEIEDDSEMLKSLVEIGFGGLVPMAGKEDK